jgi:hypothetical protein
MVVTLVVLAQGQELEQRERLVRLQLCQIAQHQR